MTMKTKIVGVGLICIFGIFILMDIFFTPHITADQTGEMDNSSLAGASGTVGLPWSLDVSKDPFTDMKIPLAFVEKEEGGAIYLVCYGGSHLEVFMKFNHVEGISLTSDRAIIRWRADKGKVNSIGAKIGNNEFVMSDSQLTRRLAKDLLNAKTFASSVIMNDKQTVRVYENLKNSKNTVGEVLSDCDVK